MAGKGKIYTTRNGRVFVTRTKTQIIRTDAKGNVLSVKAR